MAVTWSKAQALNLARQACALRKLYPEGTCRLIGPKLIWHGPLRPSPFSREYLTLIEYCRGKNPTTRIIRPSLRSLCGDRKIPHIYKGDGDPLCLFYPPADEWNSSKWIANTIVPWACEWLLHFEAWLFTGEWDGGGIHPQ